MLIRENSHTIPCLVQVTPECLTLSVKKTCDQEDCMVISRVFTFIYRLRIKTYLDLFSVSNDFPAASDRKTNILINLHLGM